MFCPNCGERIEDESMMFCPNCGEKIMKNEQKKEEPKRKPEKKEKKKKKWLIPVVIAIIIALVLGFFGLKKISQEKEIDKHIKLGNHYLKEMKYEDAVVEYNRALRIDKKSEKAKDGMVKTRDVFEKENKESFNLDAAVMEVVIDEIIEDDNHKIEFIKEITETEGKETADEVKIKAEDKKNDIEDKTDEKKDLAENKKKPANKEINSYRHQRIVTSRYFSAKITDSGKVETKIHDFAYDKAPEEVAKYEKAFESVKKWENIVDISRAGDMGILAGLTESGNILIASTESGDKIEMLTDEWEDAVQITSTTYDEIIDTDIFEFEASNNFAALKKDGTVMLSGEIEKYADVSDWKDIIQVDTGSLHITGLKKDGTVVSAGKERTKDYQNDSLKDYMAPLKTESWKDIVQISTGPVYTVGLTKDGKCLVSDTVNEFDGVGNIKKVYTNFYWYALLLDDGTVKVTEWLDFGDVKFADRGSSYISTWNNIIDITGDGNSFAGLTKDGSIRSTSRYDEGFGYYDGGRELIK